MQKLPRDFYARDAQAVVKDLLLGKVLVTRLPEGEASGIIVECEAYLGTADKAAHSFSAGERSGTRCCSVPQAMHVYLIYACTTASMWWWREGKPTGCPRQGLGALSGLELMAERRKNAEKKPHLRTRQAGSGIRDHKNLNGADLLGRRCLHRRRQQHRAGEIVARPRIGVDYAEEWAEKPLRYYRSGTTFVSKR